MQRPLAKRRHNLPASLSTFVGREREMTDLLRLLGSRRLVTLVGSGGVGKTRLALRVAADMRETYSDGLSFVDLAPLGEVALIPQVVLVALGAQGLRKAHPRDAVVEFLRPRAALVVLDNCEHLASGSAELVDMLLRACPRLVVLATSREPLGVEGEVRGGSPPCRYPVGPNDRRPRKWRTPTRSSSSSNGRDWWCRASS